MKISYDFGFDFAKIVSNLEEQMTKAIIQPLNPKAFTQEALKKALTLNEKEKENARRQFEEASRTKPKIKR